MLMGNKIKRALVKSLCERLSTGDTKPASDVSSGCADPVLDLDRGASLAAFYFRGRHGLIRRHVETVQLGVDLTGRQQLTVDFDLPRDPTARWLAGADGAHWFLFPLAFLPKWVPRTGLDLRNEDGGTLPLLTRAENGLVSAKAVLDVLASDPTKVPSGELEKLVVELVVEKALPASVALAQISRSIEKPAEVADTDWIAFEGVLRLLMEHSVLWTPIQGVPGTRRVAKISFDFELETRAIVQWRLERTLIPVRGEDSAKACPTVVPAGRGTALSAGPLDRYRSQLPS